MIPPAPNPRPALPLGEQAKARFIKILEATTDVVAMMDRAGRLLYLNIAGRRLFGWSDSALSDDCSLKDMHPAWAFELIREESIPTAIEIGCWSGETALLAADGREIPILQVILAHTDSAGEVEFLSTICRDIGERKQKELERIEWANRYDAAIRASGQVLFDWDSTTGGITYGGDVARLLGFSSDEMGGGLSRLREVIVPADLQAFDAAIEAVLLTRDPFKHEFRARRSDGVEIIIDAQGFFFLDRMGRIGRMVGFLRDFTLERTAESAVQRANERLEQRVAERTMALEHAALQLQDNARQQEAVARLGQTALAGKDVTGLMEEALDTVRSVLHSDMASVLEFSQDDGCFHLRAQSGWPTLEEPPFIPGGNKSQSGYTLISGEPIVSPDFDQERRFTPSQLVFKAGCKSGISVCIQAGQRPLGVLCAFSLRVREYSADEVSFMQSVANVLTSAIERSRVDEEARQAQREAEAANKAKSEFLSRMSHELRTPLNAILGFSQLLELESHTPGQAESIQHISIAGKNLLALINEVLDIARIESGRVNFQMEGVDVVALISEVSVLVIPLASRRAIDLRPGPGFPEFAWVSADPERLKQILLNLITNAVKYNRDGGSVTITIARTADQCWRISVTDTGHGIAEDQLGKLFVPFERLGASGGGTGLGLALCKRLVSAFDGKIGVSSVEGTGSTFWVEFPAIEPGDSREIPDADVPSGSIVLTDRRPRRKKLLYIEDDLANFYLLERIVTSRTNLELLSALQASIGIDLAREHLPDAILLDLNLPDMTGEQVLTVLKADPATAGIPVIIVTGEVGTDRPDKILGMGAAETLAKPYRVQDLLELLDRVLA